jgi:hypothetical protein
MSQKHWPSASSTSASHVKRRPFRKQGQSDSKTLAGGKDKNIGLCFDPSRNYPNMNRRLSPYNEITVQSTIETANLFTSSTTVPVYTGTVFALSAVPNYAAYTAVFDQYKIEEIEMWIFSATGPGSVTATSFGIGTWNSAVDYDDGNVPTSVGQVCDKQTNVASSIFAAHYHKWKPQYAVDVYQGTFTGFGAARGWLDSASPTVQHYGLKTACATTPTNTYVFSCIVRYTIKFRGAGIS